MDDGGRQAAVPFQEDESSSEVSETYWSVASSSDAEGVEGLPGEVEDAESNSEQEALVGSNNEVFATASHLITDSVVALADESDESIDDAELEELMFGLTGDGRPKKRRKRRKRSLYASMTLRSKPRRVTAAQPGRPLTERGSHYLREANEAYLDADYTTALAKATEVVKECPGAHDPFHLMGLIYEAYGDTKRAINAYLVAASILKRDAELWKRIGQMAEKNSADTLAIYCYRRVLPAKRHHGEIDEEAAVDLAKLLIKRLQYERAAVYLMKLYLRHLGDHSLSIELAKCFIQIPSFRAAIICLESFAAASLPPPVRDRFVVQIKDHEWLQDPETFADDAAAFGILLAHTLKDDDAAAPADFAEFPEPEDLAPVHWVGIEILFGILLDQNECSRCVTLGGKLLVQAHINSLPADADIQRFWTDPQEYQNAVGAQVVVAPLGPIVRFVAAAIRSDVATAEWLLDLLVQRMEGCDPKQKLDYHTVIADSFLAAGDPLRALKIYEHISAETGGAGDNEFWLKAAKCYIKLREFDRAAEFLEHLGPVARDYRPKQIQSLQEMQAHVRGVEARLLLERIFSGDDRIFDSLHDEASSEVTMDKRLRILIVGTSLTDLPRAFLDEATRRLIILRIAIFSDLLREASKIDCCTEIAEWIKRCNCDTLQPPQLPAQLIDLYVPPPLRPLLKEGFTIENIWDGLETAKLNLRSTKEICKKCSAPMCVARRQRFSQIWRLILCGEYALLMRDAGMDMRRILQESSKQRAQILTKKLKMNKAVEQPIIDTSETVKADWIDDVGRDLVDANSGFLIKTATKNYSRIAKQQVILLQAGEVRQHSMHRSIRDDLQVVPLETILGWLGYARFIELGTGLLVQENLPNLAIELIECLILSQRYARSFDVPGDPAHRVYFRTRCRRLVLRLAITFDIQRVTLKTARTRYVRLKQQISCQQTRQLAAYDIALILYGRFLFGGQFAHHSTTSIAASSARDVISFNRAWTMRRLTEEPLRYRVILFAGHFCILSARYVYAVAEYTRAVNLRPQSCVASLCLAAAALSFSTSRGVQDRHHAILRAYSALRRAARVREGFAGLMQARIANFAKEKISRIIGLHKGDSDFWDAFRTILGAPKLDDTGTLQLLSVRVARWVDWYAAAFKEYCDCEILYNEARAYQHLGLNYLALPIYRLVLDRLNKLNLPACYDRLARTIISVPRGCFTLTGLIILSHSDYPPALDYQTCPEHAENCTRVWYCKHAQSRLSKLQLPLNVDGLDQILLSQSREEPEVALDQIVPFEQMGWDNIKLGNDSHVILPGHPVSLNLMQSDLQDLSGIFSCRRSLDIPEARLAATTVLSNYLRNLPPGLFTLTIDRQQLKYCAAYNMSLASGASTGSSYSRQPVRSNIVW